MLTVCCLVRWKRLESLKNERHDCDSPRARYIFNLAKSGRCLAMPALAYLEGKKKNDKHDIGKAIRFVSELN